MAVIFNDAGKAILNDGDTVTTTNTANGGNTNLGLSGSSIVLSKNPSLLSPKGQTAWYEWSSQTGTAAYCSLSPSGFSTAIGASAGGWFMFTGYPSAAIQLLRVGNNGANYCGFSTAGQFYVTLNTTKIYTSSVSVAFNTPYWLSEGITLNATTGVMQFGVWDVKGNRLDFYTSANGNTSATTSGATLFGKASASGNMALFRLAGLKASTSGSSAFGPSLPPTNFGWGQAA